MSNDTGDSSSRLSDALDQIFSGARTADHPEPTDESKPAPTDSSVPDEPAPARPDAGATDESKPAPTDGGVTDEPEPYQLPQIVPATADPAHERDSMATAETAVAPRLPDRAIVPEPAPSAHTTEPDTAAPIAPVTSTPPAAAAAASAPVTGWSDHLPTQTAPAASQLRAPGRRPRVRRVTRVVRHVDPWSTFKVALLFNAVAYVVCLTSGVLLWRVADSTGTLDNIERWFTQFGWETFELDGGQVFHNAWIIGLFGVVAATGGAVLLVTLFNLVSDIVGGVRMTVLEEEVVERTISSTRRYVVRRPTEASAAAAESDWSADDLDADDGDDRHHHDNGAAPAGAHKEVSARNGDSTATRPVPVSSGDTVGTDWSVD